MKTHFNRSLALAICVLGLLTLQGCSDDQGVVYVDRTPPAAPRGIFTVTGDRQVDIYWLPSCESDVQGYRVYWNDEALGTYEYVATTSNTHFTDLDVQNGITYYYAVAAFDRSGNESDLSYETVCDTPRPEGFDYVLFDALGPYPEMSGFDFSTYSVQHYDLPSTDILYAFDGGLHIMYGWNPVPEWPDTDIQDAGYRTLEEADDAPPDGWTTDHMVILTEGHSYFVWTRDNHYAKFYVKHIGTGVVVIDWAYQTAEDNVELAPQKLTDKGTGETTYPFELTQAGGL